MVCSANIKRNLRARVSTSLMLFSVPFCKVRVVVPVAPDHVTLIGESGVISSKLGFVNCNPVLEEDLVPAGNMVNSEESVVWPDVSSRNSM